MRAVHPSLCRPHLFCSARFVGLKRHAVPCHHDCGTQFRLRPLRSQITPEQRATLKLDSIEVALSGAEPVRSQTLERFAEAFAPCGFRKEPSTRRTV